MSLCGVGANDEITDCSGIILRMASKATIVVYSHGAGLGYGMNKKLNIPYK